MRLELLDGLRLMIIAFLAYIPTVTFSGWFTAWVAKKCDDDLPERFGFLTLDPFAHFSLFGFGFLLLGQLFGDYITFFKGFPGFGRFILSDPAQDNKFKAFLIFFARGLAHLIVITLVVVVTALFSVKLVAFFSSAGLESLFVSLTSILHFFVNQNFILCIIYLLVGLVDSICYVLHIPRIFSFQYFGILLAVLLLFSEVVSAVLALYIGLLFTLMSKFGLWIGLIS